MFFFFNDTATTEIYTLSLHDALPISGTVVVGDRPHAVQPLLGGGLVAVDVLVEHAVVPPGKGGPHQLPAKVPDRKSTRLNSQSRQYLVCRLLLEKKNIKHQTFRRISV